MSTGESRGVNGTPREWDIVAPSGVYGLEKTYSAVYTGPCKSMVVVVTSVDDSMIRKNFFVQNAIHRCILGVRIALYCLYVYALYTYIYIIHIVFFCTCMQAVVMGCVCQSLIKKLLT